MKTDYHRDNYLPRLRKLAAECGVTLREPFQISARGEVLIVAETVPPTGRGFCGEYGEKLAEILRRVPCRTGDPEFGYCTGHVQPYNGWAWFRTADLVHEMNRRDADGGAA